eukprot:3245256-Rhodomonas_salina.3
MSGTDVAYGAVLAQRMVPFPYAMSGTNITYSAVSLRGVQYWHTVWCYTRATPWPVLTSRMVLPAGIEAEVSSAISYAMPGTDIAYAAVVLRGAWY